MMLPDQDDPRVPASEPSPEAPAPEVEDEAVEPETEETEGEAAAETSEAEGGEQPPKREEGERPTDRQKRNERYQRQLERLRAENNELRARTSGVRPENIDAAVARIVGPPPKQEDYGSDYLGFERAQTAYELDKRVTRREVQKQVQSQETARQAQLREAAEAHLERMEDFRQVTPDFDRVMQGASDLKASPTVEDLILESDASAHLVYYLAKNPNVLNELNEMTERQAARQIGVIESRLSMPERRTQTRAPAPFRPLTGGAAPPSQEAGLDTWLSRKYGKRYK